MSTELTPAKPIGITLAIAAGLASLWFILVTPFGTTAVETINGTAREVGRSSAPFFVVTGALQALSALCTLAAAALIATGGHAWAKRMLLAGALLGISAVPVTTGLALAAFLVIRRLPDPR